MGKRLENKIALITGASGGIGAATAELFIAEGAKVFAADLDEQLNLLAHSLGNEVHTCRLNVIDQLDWKRCIDKIFSKYGRLDILVNNAGIMKGSQADEAQNPEKCSLEDFKVVMDVNLNGVFLGCKHAIELMKKTSGSIVNVGSRSAFVGIPGGGAYAASKAAIRNYTKTVALYCASQGYNIRCNTVHPGPTITKIWEKMLKDPSIREEAVQSVAKAIPLKRLAAPMEIAYGILFFASDESSYATGAELVIDGGVLAGSAGVALKQ